MSELVHHQLNDDPPFFLAVHPQDFQSLFIENMKTIPFPSEAVCPDDALSYGPIRVYKQDLDRPDYKVSHTRFHLNPMIRMEQLPQFVGLMTGSTFMDELQIAVFEQEVRRYTNKTKPEAFVDRIFDLFERCVSLVTEIKRALRLLVQCSSPAMQSKWKQSDPSKILVAVTFETIERQMRFVSALQDKGSIVRETLAKKAADSGYPEWRFDLLAHDSELLDETVLHLKIYVDYRRICAGIVLRSKWDIHRRLATSLISPSVANYAVTMASPNNDSIVVFPSDVTGDLVNAVHYSVDCTCIVFVDDVSVNSVQQNADRLQYFLNHCAHRFPTASMRHLQVVQAAYYNVMSSFAFKKVTHMFLYVSEDFEDDDTGDGIVAFFEQLFNVLKSAVHLTTILLLSLEQSKIVKAACEEETNGRFTYPFRIVESKVAKTFDATVTILHLAMRQ